MSDTETKSTNFIKNQIDKDLQNNLHKNIQLRFPPEPNGFLHIGHAKSIFLNFGLASEYSGKCNLRLDDTNPTKENAEYITAIKDSVKWLGFEFDNLTYSSSYFDDFYKYAVELIKKDLAYVCFLDGETMREYRGTLTEKGKNSPYRDKPVAENLENFTKMKNGEFDEGACVLRLKIDMESPFMVLRDPAIYRILKQNHHQTGDKWCIYPMYDFAHPISDGIEKITHSLCTLEFQDNRRLYDWVLENIDDFNAPNRPHQYEFSRLNLAYNLMSKRKLASLVEGGQVSGWDDPRLPTIAGIRRRGYTPNALKIFTDRIGISKVDSLTDFKILEDCVREDLNENANRSMAVINPLEVEITNFNDVDDSILEIKAPNHPQNESKGNREIYFSKSLYIDKNDFLETAPNNKYKRLAVDKEVRLRNAFVIKATHFDEVDGEIVKVYATYDKDTLGKNPADGRKVKGVIHFTEKTTAKPCEFRIYDRLFEMEKPSDDDKINPNSLIIKNGFVEKNLSTNEFDTYQFEREGYFCCDKDTTNDKIIFNQSVGLRSNF
jgi:glutaminyl-tRNA synthetase